MKHGLLYKFTNVPVILMDLDFKPTTIIEGVTHFTTELIAKGELDVKGFEVTADETVGYSIHNDRTFISNTSLLMEEEFLSEGLMYEGEYPSTKKVLEALKRLADKENTLLACNSLEKENVDQNIVKELASWSQDQSYVKKALEPLKVEDNPLRYMYSDPNMQSICIEVFQLHVAKDHPLYSESLIIFNNFGESGSTKDLFNKMSDKSEGSFNAFLLGEHNLPVKVISIGKNERNVSYRDETYVIAKEGTLEEFTTKVRNIVDSSIRSLESSFWRNDHWL